MEAKKFKYPHKFQLEKGGILPEVEIAYHTYGKLNESGNNVVWVCHALTGNSEVFDWWPGLFGEGDLFNPEKYFIVCANILGSCYGTTGPLSTNPKTGNTYFHEFPEITVRDMVYAHELLRVHLGISSIHLATGGSLGGQQVLEWSIIRPLLIQNQVLIATNARMSAWGIAFNESQRMAIQADPTWKSDLPEAGQNGLKAARSIALLSYRNPVTYNTTQSENDNDMHDPYKVQTYQRYQGDKLVNRFNAFSYWHLSKVLDSHNVGRDRRGIREALKTIRTNTLVIGMDTDILFPVSEQKFLATYISGAKYKELSSLYGHDGFLIETEKISDMISHFLLKQAVLRIKGSAA